MGIRSFALALGVVCVAAASSSADDWPQWRGPQRNGISRETGLLGQWPAAGPKLLWQAKDLGGGYSTPAVAGEFLYLLGNSGINDEYVEARRVSDGSQLWSKRIGKVGNPDQKPPYPGARSTPTVEGERLYALGSDGDLVCQDIKTGGEHWRKNLRTDFGGEPGVWAYSESPLIDGDVLVCTPGGSAATLVALRKQTGETLWKCAVPGGDQAAYASVVVDEAAGVRQYVQFLQKGLVGVDAATGKFLWRYDKTAEGSPANIPTPLVAGAYVYSAAGRSGGALVKIVAKDGGLDAEQVYFSSKLPTSIGGIVKPDEFFYGTNSQSLICAEFLTGEIRWSERGIGAASVCFADGRLYLHGENGEAALVVATPDGYQEKGRFAPPDQPDRGRSKAWAYPVVANGRLYLRDASSLWCYDIRAAQGGQ